MANTTQILVDAIKQQIPSATFDTTDANYIRVGYNTFGITDKGVLSEIFDNCATNAGWQFDGYDESGAACFMF
jgi:hypothetical protein